MATAIGLVGGGRAAAIHALAASALPDVRVTHVHTRDPERTRLRAAELDAEPADLDTLAGSVDVAVVATPPDTHAELALRLADAGTAALVENPLAADPDGARRLERAELGGARIRLAEHLFGSPYLHAGLRAVAALGPLTHLSVRAQVPRSARAGWTADPTSLVGTRALGLAMVAAGSAAGTAPSPVEVDHQVAGAVRLGFAGGLDANLSFGLTDDPVGAAWELQAASADGAVRLELAPLRTLEVDGEARSVAVERVASVPDELVELGYLAQLRTAATAWERLPSAAFGARLVHFLDPR